MDASRSVETFSKTPTHRDKMPQLQGYSSSPLKMILKGTSPHQIAKMSSMAGQDLAIRGGQFSQNSANEESITWAVTPHPSSDGDMTLDYLSSPSKNMQILALKGNVIESDSRSPLSAIAADPATELLMKYQSECQDLATNDDQDSANSLQLTKSGRCRRAVSCEPEWPVSLKKRRRYGDNITIQQSRSMVDGGSRDVTETIIRENGIIEGFLIHSDDSDKDSEVEGYAMAVNIGLKEEEDLEVVENSSYLDNRSDEFGSDDDFDIALAEAVERQYTQSILNNFTAPATDRIPENNQEVVGVVTENYSEDHNDSTTGISSDHEYGFDDEDIEEIFSIMEQSAASRTASSLKVSLNKNNCKRFRRFKVEEVIDGHYSANKHISRIEKRLSVVDESTNEISYVLLRDDWCESIILVSEYIHVIGIFDDSGQCVIDNAQGFIIINPDCLVSSTHIAKHFVCNRMPVFDQRIKNIRELNKSTVYGTIIHELFQSCMETYDFSEIYMDKILEIILPRHIEKLFFLNETLDKVRSGVRERYRSIQDWAAKYMSSRPKPDAIVSDAHGSGESLNLALVEVLDTEEHIWSPMYGLKGSIDLTVTVNVGGRGQQVVPFEVKTGRKSNVMNHRAQTALYTLMLSDRYDMEVVYGILFYLDLSDTICVTSVRNEIRGLIIGRNEVARNLVYPNILIPMSLNSYTCRHCFSTQSCLTYHKTIENGTSETSGLGSFFDEVTGHITKEDSKFFKHWDNLISTEELNMMKFRQEIWLMNETERENVGRCFGNLVVDHKATMLENEQINRYEYTLSKASSSGSPRQSFLESQISVGDPIVVSDNKNHIGLAKGFVRRLNPESVIVTVDRQFEIGRRSKDSSQSSIKYRVDKDEFSNGMSIVRDNLVQLLSKDSRRGLKEAIVELKEPRFQISGVTVPESVRNCVNSDQLRAISASLSASDYSLIMGMPGTGKTTTISYLIKSLLAHNKTVLLASYTHTAVDNILLKIRDFCPNILRLGPVGKIHPEVRQFASVLSDIPKDFDNLHKFYFEPPIVATTCLSINSFVLQKRRFDYCIIDEASQVTLPVCIGPLRFADKFVLVGDHYQLPPLVRSKEAKFGGLDISLFKILSDAQPKALVAMEYQYRMCEEVMTLSNALIYDGRLKCGSQEVAKRKLEICNLDGGLHAIHRGSQHSSCWISDLLSEDRKVVFVDTDSIPLQETVRGDRVQNEVEADLVCQFAESLILCGVPINSLGIISVYRAQLKIISHALQKYSDLEMQTVDKFQGRDKECILISLVRSNDEQKVGTLLTDWRRLNVTFTRARSKIVMFGSRKTLSAIDIFGKFFSLVQERNWMYSIPSDAHLQHPSLKFLTTQTIGNNLDKKLPRKPVAIKNDKVLRSRPVLRDIINEANF
ncbi:DNA replication factor Dna2-domain-containing protein [Dipodascopsis uninucleata]